jgi:hypothetical protein
VKPSRTAPLGQLPETGTIATAANVLEFNVVAAAPALDLTVMPLEIMNSEGAV